VKRAHRDLRVWQEAMALVEMVYRLTSAFPPDERFGLVSQMRRAAVSVPSNIAEGSARKGTRELIHFLSLAVGSLAELDTQLALSARLGFPVSGDRVSEKIDEVSALALALIQSLRRKAA
jgi:four helix bundle protein